jgi:hypothetical protein
LDVPITTMVQRLELGEHKRLILTLWEKKVFYNWPCNSIFDLHWTLAIHHLYNATHYNSITTQLQLCHNNSFSTIMQFPYDYNDNVMLTSFFIHPWKFNTWHYEDFSWFFKNINIHHPLWLFVLNGLGLSHMTQSKFATWHINWILETNIYIYT